ncbi:MAG: Rrf2 family transcriptional regulator [Polaromonas sp.]|uniref:Rrf2 family transcriptional regulator n=1 Tax=Polaromonas sp. TaxID=1869339 RepID=UPI004035609C
MKRDSRLSGVLHVLLHMAEVGEPLTSDELANVMLTHPVVVRRVMAGLRDSGLVRSEKGHGGGWVLSCNLEDITLGDIYNALDAPELFAMGNRTEAPGCLVEQAVNAALDSAFAEARQLLLNRLGDVSLATLSQDFHARRQARGATLAAAMAHNA